MGSVAEQHRPAAGPALAAHGAEALTDGVVGSAGLGRQLGHRNIISTDVGGTTFLAGLIVDGEPVRDTTTVINHHPVNVPTLRVDAIGSGGGAIAWLDPGGNLRIGPRSAQAVPGPACYGNGGSEPTNTDANLVLGILPERGLLGGRKPLSLDLARQAIGTRIDMRYAMQLAEVATPVADGPLDGAAIEAAAAAFEQRYAALYGADTGCSPDPRSSRSRPPPWSCPAAPPRGWTRSAT